MLYHPNRSERSKNLGKIETTPNEVQEAHVSLILAIMEQEYKENGVNGLEESPWTDMMVTHAVKQGMKVNKDMLLNNIRNREQSKKQGNFFTDLNEALTVMREGIMQDRNIRVLDGYVA